MRIRDKQSEEQGGVNLMPLLDMVFLLLIFFLVATQFAQKERDQTLQLPKTTMAKPLSSPPQQLIINIKPNGSMSVGPRTLKGPDALRDLLVRITKNQPNREVLIRCDERAIHKYFADVARICREEGISELKIGYLIKPSAKS